MIDYAAMFAINILILLLLYQNMFMIFLLIAYCHAVCGKLIFARFSRRYRHFKLRVKIGRNMSMDCEYESKLPVDNLD